MSWAQCSCEWRVCPLEGSIQLNHQFVLRAYERTTKCGVVRAVCEQLPFLFPPALIFAIRRGLSVTVGIYNVFALVRATDFYQ